RHYGYWGHMGSATGTPEIQAPRQSYQAEIDSLKSWIVRRINWMDQNMFGNSINCLFTGINSTNNVITPANVFPNPFKDEIYISIYLERTQKLDLSIHDATGKLVFQMIDVQMNSGENKLNFILPDELNSGTYFLHISEEKHSWVKKIIKMD
ncbi:MAG: T9SS type A sorting domain-containing protein, partial [Bacteroidota bacterium]